MPWLTLSLSCPQPTPIGTMHSEVQVQPPNRDKAQPHTKHQVSSDARARGSCSTDSPSPAGPLRGDRDWGVPSDPSAVCGRGCGCGWRGDLGSVPRASWPGSSRGSGVGGCVAAGKRQANCWWVWAQHRLSRFVLGTMSPQG